MILQLFYRFDKLENGDRWRISIDISDPKKFFTISSDDTAKIFHKVISQTSSMPFSFFFVVEHSFNDSVRFTIVNSIDDICTTTVWIENLDVYDEIMLILERGVQNG